jgi:hypothetical protein
MAYDEGLADRVRGVIAVRPEVTERRMFGSLAWLVQGNLAVAVTGEELLVRVAPGDAERVLAEPHVRTFDMGGRTMRGFVVVGAEGIAADEDLAHWVDEGADVAMALPPKAAKAGAGGQASGRNASG